MIGLIAVSRSTGVVQRRQDGLYNYLWLHDVLDVPWDADANGLP